MVTHGIIKSVRYKQTLVFLYSQIHVYACNYVVLNLIAFIYFQILIVMRSILILLSFAFFFSLYFLAYIIILQSTELREILFQSSTTGMDSDSEFCLVGALMWSFIDNKLSCQQEEILQAGSVITSVVIERSISGGSPTLLPGL